LKKIYLNTLVLILISIGLNAQDFFSKTKPEDTVTGGFYARKIVITTVPVMSYRFGEYGLSVLVHNNKDRLSYYYDVSINFYNKFYIVYGRKDDVLYSKEL